MFTKMKKYKEIYCRVTIACNCKLQAVYSQSSYVKMAFDIHCKPKNTLIIHATKTKSEATTF